MQKHERLKVLLISPYSSKKVGGIGTWTKNLLDYVALNVQSVDLIFQNTAFCVKGNLVKNKFDRFFWGTIDALRIILSTVYNIMLSRPDVIHYTSSASIALFKDYVIAMVCSLLHVRFVIHFHFGRIPELSLLNNWEWRWILKVSKLARAVIVIDNASFQVMKAQAYSDKVFYIPNPVSKEIFRIAKTINDSRKRYSAGKVVFAGHVIPAKGVFELIEACTGLVEVKQLVICGPYFEEIKGRLSQIASKREEGRWLVFKGEIKREEVIKELEDCLIFCMPSYTEGFPNAVMEAMAMACAVVATDVGAIPEMLDWGTEKASGCIINVKDADGIRSALKQLIDNEKLAVELGKNGNRKILCEYNLDVIYPQYYKTWTL